VSLLLAFGVAGALGTGQTAAASTPPPDSTINEFIPEDRAISDCISAAPRPGCGSKNRSDWHQGLVLGVMAAGMTVIGWRIVAGLRRAPAQQETADTPK